MGYTIKKNKITLTRGDTLRATVKMRKPDGSFYTPEGGDSIRFALSTDVGMPHLITKNINPSTMVLKLDPEDTQNLDFGKYVYDIEITYANGEVDTFIEPTKDNFVLKGEVDHY